MKELFKQLMEKLIKAGGLSTDEQSLLDRISAAIEAGALTPRRLPFGDDRSIETRTIKEILTTPARACTPVEQELQAFSDDVYILSTLLKCNPRATKYWQQKMADASALRKAMDAATAGEGLEWVPTMMSAELIQKFRLESKVAQLFVDIPMPSNPYDLPYISGTIEFYGVAESTSDEPAKSPPSTPGTGKRTLTAKKFKARVLFSDEVSEDSIIPILPSLKDELGMAGAEAIDDVVINGDTTAPHMDSNVTDSKDRKKLFSGLRKLCPAATKADLATFDKTTTLSLKAKMGKFGIKPDRIVWINGISVYNKMLALAEVITVDKYGPAATILTGEIGRLYGAPIVISERIGETFNATGIYDGTTMNKTILPLVNRDAFLLGTRGLPKLKFEEEGAADQNQLTLSFRKAFIDRYAVTVAANTTVALGYNIAP